MMLLLDGQSGTIVLDPTRDELEEAKTQVSRRHRLELQLEGVVESAGGHARRPADPAAWATWTCPRRSRPPCGIGAQGVGLLRTEFLLTGRATLPDRGRAGGRTSAGSPRPSPGRPSSSAPSTSAATSSRSRSRPRRRPTRSSAGARSASAWTSRRCSGRRCARVLRAAVGRDIQLMLPLVTLVEEVIEARAIVQEEARSAQGRRASAAAETVPVGVMIETPGGRADRRPPGGGQRLLQRRHQRPHPVHPGGGPGQRPAGRPLHARITRRSSGSSSRCSRSGGRPASR